MSGRFVVTIDGPAGAGKSTTARAVAAQLGFLYLDTGALYRALAYKVLEHGLEIEAEDAILELADTTRFELSGRPGEPHVWLDGADVSGEIRTPTVSEMASRLAARPLVRRHLVGIQRHLADRGPVVAEGRDLGTVVFPDAAVKIYLDADITARTRRRAAELQGRGIAVKDDQVRQDLDRRDARDRDREEGPLRQAEDARVIDTSAMQIEEQVEAVVRAVRAHPDFPGEIPAPGPREAST